MNDRQKCDLDTPGGTRSGGYTDAARALFEAGQRHKADLKNQRARVRREKRKAALEAASGAPQVEYESGDDFARTTSARTTPSGTRCRPRT